MPPNKKKVRNKKASAAARQPSISNPLSSLQNKKVAPDDTEKSKSNGLYSMYKEATLRFHHWMSWEACLNLRMTAVDDYRKGLQLILDRNRKAYLKEETENFVITPPEIMTSLASSIRLREKVTSEIFGSKDGGDNAIGGRFNALTFDELGEEDEEEVDWEDLDLAIRKGELPKYGGIEVEEEIGICEAFLKVDDKMQVVYLLLTMNESMGRIRGHYELLKNFMHHSPRCMRGIMECAAVTNAATNAVYQAESELMLEHPHLSSFYHIVAIFFFSNVVEDINKRLKTTKKEKEPYMAFQFVAEMVENSFYLGGGQAYTSATVKRFVKKSGLEQPLVNDLTFIISNNTFWETLLDVEERYLGVHVNDPSKTGIAAGKRPHTWLDPLKHIGGDSCILNTQKIVQIVMKAFKENTLPRFGTPSFDESKNPSKRIRGDLDGTFASMILPELFLLCRDTPHEYLPNRSHFNSVLTLLHRHVKSDLAKPVPISLTFGLHSVLMSIYVLQGNGDLARVAVNTKQSYRMLFQQWRTELEKSKAIKDAPLLYKSFEAYSSFEGFAKPVRSSEYPSYYDVDPLKAELLAFWNPLIGGVYMLNAAYTCSIGLGAATMDSRGQLIFVLHLYNGLRLRGPTFEIPLLRDLDRIFEHAKYVWVEGRPGKGFCCEMFWLSWGLNARRATNLASKHTANGDPRSGDWAIEALADTRRKVNGLCPENISTSYRPVVRHDFTTEDPIIRVVHRDSKEASASDKEHCRSLLDLWKIINVTHDAMDKDESVLPMNLPAVGLILLQFVDALSVHMGWSVIIENVIRKKYGARFYKPQKETAATSLANVDLCLDYIGLSHFWGRLLSCIDRGSIEHMIAEYDIDKACAFAKTFFNDLVQRRYVYFDERLTSGSETLQPATL
ncbi:hypothetical protein FisN_24Hu205 [Fistulifera solaris]|uniref:Uncharacterized protein n=1 Tax=Fistulifera solaris TaxID=1519565 RepID=A0A1Z5JUY5_FISSO|nr:hypothetical protein FisN_24Hu205 [Fistulifera solaris]|eukprot:GAX17729.1 hypothetical protein FisN_24Hu205 [Fistulifera solaris]